MTARKFRKSNSASSTRLAILLMVLVSAVLLLTACRSPDDYEIEEGTASPTEAASEPTATSTATASVAEVTATPTATSIVAPTSTSTIAPNPTATAEPTATPEPSSTSTTAPSPTATASAADVWNLRQFDTDERVMVLTFDAGADTGFAADILDILAEEGIHASFGMTGPWAEENPDLVLRMVNEGHQLLNHSWSHPHFPELTSAERVDEIQRLENYIRDLTGVELQPYFRPPFGEYDEATLADLASHGYTINVLWTIDTLGWKGLSADEINARVLDGAAPGAIVLMHVGSQSQDAAALPEMIHQLRAQGYTFATVAELAE